MVGGDPGPEDPSEHPLIPEPDEWKQIDPGWWSHERYEEYVVRHGYTQFEDLLPKPEDITEKRRCEVPEEQAIKDTNLLDKIVMSWNGNAFDFEGFEGDRGYLRIRVIPISENLRTLLCLPIPGRGSIAHATYGADEAGAQATAQSERIRR
jgi:hypothetical protein